MALLCVDTSGSMAGGRIQAATSGMHTLVQALKPRDVLGVYKFNTTVDVLQTFVRNHKIDWQAHIAGLNAAPSGSTALHDAIMQSMDALQKYAKPKHDDTQLRVVVVLTDGDDNASKTHTLDTVIQRVHSSTIANFHFMLLGVVSTRASTPHCSRTTNRICTTSTSRTRHTMPFVMRLAPSPRRSRRCSKSSSFARQQRQRRPRQVRRPVVLFTLLLLSACKFSVSRSCKCNRQHRLVLAFKSFSADLKRAKFIEPAHSSFLTPSFVRHCHHCQYPYQYQYFRHHRAWSEERRVTASVVAPATAPVEQRAAPALAPSQTPQPQPHPPDNRPPYSCMQRSRNAMSMPTRREESTTCSPRERDCDCDCEHGIDAHRAHTPPPATNSESSPFNT
jgi:uncharacterized protein YegL